MLVNDASHQHLSGEGNDVLRETEMPEPESSLETRVERLEQELHQLRETVAALQGRQVSQAKPVVQPADQAPEDASEEILGWVGRSSLLPRLSSLCFLLVIALALRTIADNDLLDKQVGSLLGMVYAGALMFFGWYQYQRQSSLAPVLTLCGGILMYTIVVETHERFESLPSTAAYVLVISTGAGMALISHLNRRALPILAGTLGMCFAGVALDYPNPSFLALAVLLLAANLLGFWASRLGRCSWLRWTLLVVSIVMLVAWGLKIGVPLSKRTIPAPSLAAGWYLPIIAGFALLFMAESLFGILRAAGDRVARFDLATPAINVAWAFVATAYVVNLRSGSMVSMGILGGAVALGHLGIALWLGRRKVPGRPGGNAYLWAGTILLGLAIPAITGDILLSLLVMSPMALGVAVLSERWGSGGARLTSYLIQIYVCLALVASLFGSEASVPSVLAGAVASTAAVAAYVHFRWCRRYPPVPGTLFAQVDTEGRSAVLLLMVALVNLFSLFRLGLFKGLEAMGGSVPYAFNCGQSVLINVSAGALILYGFTRRDKEIRNLAILVTVIGAVKVFFFDLFGTEGLPLVISVFSFGLAAALESVVLSRWQRLEGLGQTKGGEGSGVPEGGDERGVNRVASIPGK